jgi:glycerol-3-phosphate acyltransferase PlsY
MRKEEDEMAWLQIGLLVLIAYAIGAIPNGLLAGRLLGRDMLREGSGKLGTTNTMRVLGRPAGVAVFAGDLAKGVLAGLLPRLVAWPDPAWAALALGATGAAAIGGHNWSLWVRLIAGRWGGGRGLVPALGATLLVQPLVGLVGVLGAAGGLVASRYMVIGAITAVLGAFTAAGVLVALGALSPWLLPGTGAWGVVVLAGYHDSLRRFVRGEEPRLGPPARAGAD